MLTRMSFPRPFGRYVLEERLALGGMAEIFRARTRTEGFAKRICIKRILPSFLDSADFVMMFRDEAALAARLTHTNVVQVFDFGEEDGSLFLAMEFIDGADLRTLMKEATAQGERFPIGQAVQIAIQMCRGLHYAHTLVADGTPLHIVHRDISPHNVLISRAGEVKITDFGIAKAAARSTHTGTGVVKGKLAYMAPEQVRAASLDHRVDLFATGIVLWEMLTGERLYQAADEVSLLQQVLACETPAPSSVRAEIPRELDDLVLRCLAADAQARFDDMHVLEKALSRFLFAHAEDPDSIDVRQLVQRFLPASKPRRKTAILKAPAAIPSSTTAPTPEPAGASPDVLRTASVFTDGRPADDVSTDADAPRLLDAAGVSTVPERPLQMADTSSEKPDQRIVTAPMPVPQAEPEDTAETQTWTSLPPQAKPAGANTEAISPREPTPATSGQTRAMARSRHWKTPMLWMGTALGLGLAWGKMREPTAPAGVPPIPSAQNSGAARPPRMAPLPGSEPSPAVGPAAAPTLALRAAVPQDRGDAPMPTDVAAATAPQSPGSTNLREASPPPRAKAASERASVPTGPRTRPERLPAARPTGKAWVEMHQGWAHVYLGKKLLCETPCFLTLPVGSHELIFESSYEGRFTQTVQIRAEQTTRLQAGKSQK